MRIVLDTNVLVRAAVSETGPAFELLSHIETEPTLTLILSEPIIAEVDSPAGRV